MATSYRVPFLARDNKHAKTVTWVSVNNNVSKLHAGLITGSQDILETSG